MELHHKATPLRSFKLKHLFRGVAFVLGHTMLGDAKNQMYFLDDDDDAVTLGKTRGSRTEYRELTLYLNTAAFAPSPSWPCLLVRFQNISRLREQV